MVGQGAGPSRRSHTKSRKGCKTCKRRHIRCDETYPQCNNCTKHQVQCDYMESIGSDSESRASPEQSFIALTPGSENRVDTWQQTGTFPYPDLNVFPHPQTQEYSRNELRLIHHLSTISNDLLLKGSSGLTIWTDKMPKFLSIASSYPFVMHALLSFSANHLAWESGSAETRNLQIQHGSVALRGLHDAIGNFSNENADAVLAASLLMLWQATDWRSWSSLRSGLQSVLTAMQSWKHESRFAEYIEEKDLLATAMRTHNRRPSLSPADRRAILQNVMQALQQAQLALSGNELELYWIERLIAYIQQLSNLNPAKTAEEQFNQLYYLRKLLFWVPISLLQRNVGQGPTMVTLAHFYATALNLEQLFPDLGSSFSAAIALPPLEAIIDLSDAMLSGAAPSTDVATFMQFPRQTAISYRSRAIQMQPSLMRQDSTFVSPDAMGAPTMGNMSPAFAPSPLHYGTPQSASSSQSPFLEVPTLHQGFSYGIQGWGGPSPGLPAQNYGSQDEQMQGYMLSISGFRGGFVAPTPIWT